MQFGYQIGPPAPTSISWRDSDQRPFWHWSEPCGSSERIYAHRTDHVHEEDSSTNDSVRQPAI